MPIPKDTLWKAIIEDLFDDFCYYFFPKWAESVPDFSKLPEFLDKELDALYPKDDPSKRFADKLVKVFTKEGKEHWILIHIEVQGYQDLGFPERMFTYFHRIRDRYGKVDLMALVILTDGNATFNPTEYRYRYEKTEIVYTFASFKLLEKSEAELNVPYNPFSVVMRTAKKALQKNNLSDAAQMTWKRELVVALKEANYPPPKIRRILHFIKNYVVFRENHIIDVFEEFVSNTFTQRKSMGIEEVVKQYHEAQRAQAIKEGLEEGLKEGLKQLEQTKIKGIRKALLRGKLDFDEIADIFEVSLAFVKQVQDGEVK